MISQVQTGKLEIDHLHTSRSVYSAGYALKGLTDTPRY